MASERSLRKLTPTLFVVAALSLAGCSHRTPYIRDAGSVETPPASSLVSRIILVGDAGETNAPVLSDVGSWAGEAADRTMVIFLGDNLYPEGMTPGRQDEADSKLLPQIETASGSGARVLFVPGNHDWDDGGAGGYDAILAQASYVSDHTGRSDAFLPADACPGPVAIDELPGVRIIAIDTQWWLHERDKPVEACPNADPMRFAAALSSLLDTDRTIVIAAHHPLFGFGRHAGFSEWREHLLPPIVGTVVALKRKLAPRSQDYDSEPYRAMTDLFRSAISADEERNNLLIWAAGHEHSLQVLDGQVADYVLVSGSAANTTPVGDGPGTLFAHSHPGFMVVDVLESGRVWLRVVEPDGGEVFGRWLDRQD